LISDFFSFLGAGFFAGALLFDDVLAVLVVLLFVFFCGNVFFLSYFRAVKNKCLNINTF